MTDSETTTNPLWTRKQAAARCNVSTETIKRWQKRRILPAIIINSRVVRYRAEDVERLISQGEVR